MIFLNSLKFSKIFEISININNKLVLDIKVAFLFPKLLENNQECLDFLEISLKVQAAILRRQSGLKSGGGGGGGGAFPSNGQKVANDRPRPWLKCNLRSLAKMQCAKPFIKIYHTVNGQLSAYKYIVI